MQFKKKKLKYAILKNNVKIYLKPIYKFKFYVDIILKHKLVI